LCLDCGGLLIMLGDIWHVLGIEPTEDLRAIKRAYARKVKENNPEDAPEQFQAIRNAYEIALSYADRETAELGELLSGF
jgi:DnaJ-class molecular chaperone